MLQFLRALSIIGLFFILHSNAQATSLPNNHIVGWIESLKYTPESNVLKVRGSAYDQETGQRIENLEIFINQEPAKITELRQLENQTKDFGRTSGPAGFIATVVPQKPLSAGWPTVEVFAISTDGTKTLLNSKSNIGSRFHVQKTPSRHWIFASLVLIGTIFAYIKSFRIFLFKLAVRVDKNYGKILSGLIFTFILIVTIGVNGGAVGKLKISPVGNDITETTGFDGKLFKLRNIRGDEGAILIPNALAQLNSTPKFPIINHNIGLDGQNMGVIGMTGVPIGQIAAIARPATWGYFFLPLRQALSWQWNLPFFSCLIGLWLLLNVYNSKGKGYNLALAFSYCLAPYAAAWSNWPLYASIFPIGLLLAWALLLKKQNTIKAIAIGSFMGWLFSAWIFVLYPPWQVSIGTLMLMVGVGYALDNRDRISFGKTQLIGLIAGLGVSALIISSWWWDTKTAIHEVSSTIYPGQRNALIGGTGTLSWLLRGFTNAETLSFGTGPASNESEISSYFYVPWIIVILGIWKCSSKNGNQWSIRALLVFFAFWFSYYFIGFPSWLSNFTLWGRVPTDRADLSLGLACTLMLTFLWNPSKNSKDSRPTVNDRPFNSKIAVIASIVSGAIVYTAMHGINNEVFSRNSGVYEFGITVAVVFMVWWMMRDQLSNAIGMVLLLSIVSVIGFNPIFIGPKSISLSSTAKILLTSKFEKQLYRTLFVGSGESALQLAGLGVPMVNGIFYYPQPSLWHDLKLNDDQRNIVNRYQHLDFRLKTLSSRFFYEVNSERLDQVAVTIDPRRFDFSKIGVERVMTVKNDHEPELLENNSLEKIGESSGIVWFSVAHKINSVAGESPIQRRD